MVGEERAAAAAMVREPEAWVAVAVTGLGKAVVTPEAGRSREARARAWTGPVEAVVSPSAPAAKVAAEATARAMAEAAMAAR
jgi:hypothetical protein